MILRHARDWAIIVAIGLLGLATLVIAIVGAPILLLLMCLRSWSGQEPDKTSRIAAAE